MRLHESLKTLYKLAASVDGAESLSGWLKEQADRRVEELIQERLITKPDKEEECTAFVSHGPGHRSRTACYLKGLHNIHETRYGSYDQLARWKGDHVFSGYFDEPPRYPEGEE